MFPLFKFKIVSKILADRLAPIMKNIISTQKRGFIQGRNIRDCVCVTSKAFDIGHPTTISFQDSGT